MTLVQVDSLFVNLDLVHYALWTPATGGATATLVLSYPASSDDQKYHAPIELYLEGDRAERMYNYLHEHAYIA